MRIAIMQPYLFPYLGYYQLMNHVDRYVIYDDVSYMKGGYVNRNYILLGDKKHLFTLQLSGASSNVNINHVGVGNNASKLVRMIRQGYARAPYSEAVMPLVERAFKRTDGGLSSLLTESIKDVCGYLGIETQPLISSELAVGQELAGQERVLAIVKALGGTQYINTIGGRDLYCSDRFREEGIDLKFFRMKPVTYDQGTSAFVPNLSILDVMMHNSPAQIQGMMGEFELV